MDGGHFSLDRYAQKDFAAAAAVNAAKLSQWLNNKLAPESTVLRTFEKKLRDWIVQVTARGSND